MTRNLYPDASTDGSSRLDHGNADNATKHVKSFAHGGGEAGVFLRAFDWTATELGAPQNWPQSLRSAVRLMLSLTSPVAIFWGPSLVFLYNDPLRDLLDSQVGFSGFGKPGLEAWSNGWAPLKAKFEIVLAGESLTLSGDYLVTPQSARFQSEAPEVFSCSPIDDDASANGIGGVLMVGTPSSDQQPVNAASQLSFSRQHAPHPDADVAGIGSEEQSSTELEVARLGFKEAAELNSVILEHSLDVICIIDAQGRFEKVSASSSVVFGFSPEELRDRQYIDLVVEADVEKTSRTAQSIMAGQPTRAFENRYRRKDGSVVHILWSAVWISEQNRMICVARDMSERMATEETIRQWQKTEAIGRLSGGLAHDFNNLLTVIMGNSEVLVEHLASDRQMQPLALMIAEAARRGAELTQRLLAFARRQPLDPQVVDVNALITNMNGMVARLLGEHIEIKIVPATDLWRALVDQAQLESALLNMAINALDAMPKGGLLTIETRNTRLEDAYADKNPEVEAGDYVEIAVSDTGHGITKEDLTRVFEPFFTTKEKGKGTGLGLSMVFGFVKQSKGHVVIYSEPEHGTTVRMYLPRTEAIGPAIDDSHPATLNTGSALILLVEDDELVSTYVQEQLKSLGYRVMVAFNGADGLELLLAHPEIDLLFTDVVMPGGMTGKDLAEAARLHRPELRVLYSSGYSENALIHHGRLDPGVHLLSKPYRKAELARKLADVLVGCNPVNQGEPQ